MTTNQPILVQKMALFLCIVLICCVFITLEPRFAASDTGPLLREKFPALSSGMFATAIIEPLDKGTVLLTDGLTITEADLKQAIASEEPELQNQLEKNLFFMLEQKTVRQLLLREVKKETIRQDSQDDESRIKQFLAQKSEGLSVPEEEVIAFYKENRYMMGTATVEDLKESIQYHLLQEKRQEAEDSYLTNLTDSFQFRLNGKWVEEQNRLTLDNPVDKARSSGKPTMAEFGATGCVPCDMMQPILNGLRKNHKNTLNVVFVDIGEEQILGARYGIRSIPVQVFFDASGREVFRHSGFFSAEETQKQLLAIGVTR